jgi:hypothetical protein
MPKIKITSKHFTDERTNRLFSPGEWDVDAATAARLIKNGKAVSLEKAAKSSTPAPPAPPKTTTKPAPVNPRIPVKAPEDGTEPQVTALPEDFPSREVLAENGFATVESLKAEDIKTQLEKIDGLGAAEITRIGLAISQI